MPYTEAELQAHCKRIGRCRTTLWRWHKEGCDLNDHASVQKWLERNKLRVKNWSYQQELRGQSPKDTPAIEQKPVSEAFLSAGNGKIAGEPGKRGAAAALERLEHEEEVAHRRLQAALAGGNSSAIEQAESFWLKCSETLRRLDLAVETARREAETQVPLRVAQEAVTAASEWTRIAFMQFLSSEARAMMGIHDTGEWRTYAIDRFKGVLHYTIKNAEKTNSAVPHWGVERIKAAWNVPKNG